MSGHGGPLARLHGRVVHPRRVRVLAQHLAELAPPRARVLDVGAGDGRLTRALADARPDLELTAVEAHPRSNPHYPVQPFDGRRLEHPARSFDAVCLVDVLHHADDPLALLAECARVTRSALLIKDHLREGFFAGPTLTFMDWIGNARHGVARPGRYLSAAEWARAFHSTGLAVDAWRIDLGLYPFPANRFFERKLHFVARLLLDD